MARPNLNIKELTSDERLDLIEELWDSLAATPSELALTDAQRKELDRRLEEMDRDDNLGIPWDEVVSEIRKRAHSSQLSETFICEDVEWGLSGELTRPFWSAATCCRFRKRRLVGAVRNVAAVLKQTRSADKSAHSKFPTANRTTPDPTGSTNPCRSVGRQVGHWRG
jgi:putative addiction module component (TIGR02574 family)